ncbi:hypothetical protein [Schlesneria paludicola]|uniref:hypothetical protein n=1 Tax=Schlesneria paludicola TaxID=360056 RepID=UPI00029B2C8B|nr:hypothetical protein [Schlesneria paludicola]
MATMTLNLDDQVSNGLDLINQHLEEMAIEAEQSAKSVNVLNQSFTEQTIVLNEASTNFADLGKTAITTFGEVSKAAIQEGASVARWAIGGTVAISGLKAAFGEAAEASNGFYGLAAGAAAGYMASAASDTAKFVALQAAKKAALFGVEQAAIATGSATLGAAATAGPYVLAGIAAWKGFELVLDNTGKKFEGFTEDVTNQTSEQAAAFDKFIAEAERLGMTLDELATSRGVQDVNKYLEETFGVKTVEKYSSNLDRLSSAFGDLGSTVSLNMGESGEAIGALIDLIPDLSTGLGKMFDESVTASATYLTDSVNSLNKALDDGVISARALAVQMSGGSYQAYVDEILAIRELKEVHAGLEAMRERQAPGFERLRSIQQQMADEARDREEKERVASIKTIEGINNEILALQKKGGELARTDWAVKKIDPEKATKAEIENNQRALKAAEESAQAHAAAMKAVEDRKRAVIKETEEAEKKAHEGRQKRYAELVKAEENRVAQMQKVMDAERKRADSYNKFAEALGHQKQDQAAERQITLAKEELAIAKQIAAEKMRSGGAKEPAIKAEMAAMDKEFAGRLHDEKLRQIDVETKRKLDAIQKERVENDRSKASATDKAVADAKLLSDADKIRFDREKSRMAENGKFQRDTIEANSAKYREAQAEMFRAEQERHDKAKALEQGALSQAFDPKAMMANTNQQDVLKAMQKARASKAMDAQADKDVDLINQMHEGGGPESPAERRARQTYERNQKVAESKARRSVVNDFENGNLNQGEVEQAQAKVASATLQQFGQQSGVNQSMVASMIETFKTMEQQQQALAGVQQVVQQIMAAQKGQKAAATKSAQNTQNQLGMIGQ